MIRFLIRVRNRPPQERCRTGLSHIAEATERLKPQGVATVLSVGVHARFDLGGLRPDRFRAAHPTIGLRIIEPAGAAGDDTGDVDAEIPEPCVITEAAIPAALIVGAVGLGIVG